MAEGGSRTEVKFLRKELATQLEECTRAHNLYRQSNDLDHVPSEDWIIQLENVTATYYGRIDEYIRTVNRPPSAVPSNPSVRSRQSIRSNTKWLDPNHPRANQKIPSTTKAQLQSAKYAICRPRWNTKTI
ncbi:hypothetical protein DAPPUDRAFT_272422 [Daphnia pulex]|uniref:Uncharacterized protein n=1 Tax=Daphnia pulex TaxID=6669 RepID=E9I308_DAPPU|nr:hypothetical protein DAPPUDRAFT_272422 [Daphnia pulex]|eukprot:EFX61621.1 hypothetical protein DAPPUDRAFT_272422 [Daphnia pulex]